MSTLAILLALGASICWALAMILAKIGLKWMGLVSFAAIRPLFALLFIVPYGLLTSGFHHTGFGIVGIAVLAGFLDAFVGSLLFLVAIKRSPAHKASALSLTAPFWGVVAAVLFLGERPQLVVYVAAVLVISGAYFLAGGRDAATSNDPRLSGIPLALAAGILWGVTIVPAKYCLSHGMTPITYTLIGVATAGVSWGLIAIIYKSTIRPLRYSWRGLGIALLTAFTSFFLGSILWLSGLKLAPASLLAPVNGTMPLFAFLFSVLLLRERPSARSTLGVLLVSAGVFLVGAFG